MDTLTHALSGALIARVTARRVPRADDLPLGRRVFVGFLAGAFPDIDVAASYLSPLAYLYHHRGVTHSLLMLPVWAVLLALVFAALWRFKPGWKAYVGVAACALATHIAGDWITGFGTMLLAPLSDARFALGTTFIIDLWFTGIIAAGLLASLVWRRSRLPAALGAGVLVGYVAFQWVLLERAIDFGERYARSLDLERARVTAVPRPVSPFNWTVIVEHREGYAYAHVNLVRRTPRAEPAADANFFERLGAPYRPLAHARWISAERYGNGEETALARETYLHPDFRFFRWFAVYPALLRVESANPERCVWFHDLRFLTPARPGTPFVYGMCRKADGPWRPFKLEDGERLAVY